MVDPLVQGGFTTPDQVSEVMTSHQRLLALQAKGINVDSLLGTQEQQPQYSTNLLGMQ
jgi:hypothetical protein